MTILLPTEGHQFSYRQFFHMFGNNHIQNHLYEQPLAFVLKVITVQKNRRKFTRKHP